MNWHNTLKDIYQKLEVAGYDEIRKDIHEGQLSGGTGGEIFSIVLTKLIEIKRHNPFSGPSLQEVRGSERDLCRQRHKWSAAQEPAHNTCARAGGNGEGN